MQYYYNLNIKNINEHEEYSIIEDVNERIYIFKKLYLSVEELEEIWHMIVKYDYPCYKIIMNNSNKLATDIDDNNYVLIQVEKTDEDNGANLVFSIVNEQKTNIEILWEQKLDYYMRQIAELGCKNQILINSFSYYLGLAENAISLYKESKIIDGVELFSISHRRVYFPNYNLHYLDPTNLIIDTRVRDMAEYFKAKFFSSSLNLEELIEMIDYNNLSNKEIYILYARMLYPTYYFDIFEQAIMSEKFDSKRLEKIINNRNKYEQILKQFMNYVQSKIKMKEIEWLKKEL